MTEPDDDIFIPARGEPNTAVEHDGLVFVFGDDGSLALTMNPDDFHALAEQRASIPREAYAASNIFAIAHALTPPPTPPPTPPAPSTPPPATHSDPED